MAARRSAIATRFALPTLIPRSRATYVGTSQRAGDDQASDGVRNVTDYLTRTPHRHNRRLTGTKRLQIRANRTQRRHAESQAAQGVGANEDAFFRDRQGGHVLVKRGRLSLAEQVLLHVRDVKRTHDTAAVLQPRAYRAYRLGTGEVTRHRHDQVLHVQILHVGEILLAREKAPRTAGIVVGIS